MSKKQSIKKALTVVTSLAVVIAISICSAVIIHDKRGKNAVTTSVENGLSAYELAVQYGYEGTVQEWLQSLNGKSAYEIAKDNGYTGSESDWAKTLKATAGKDGVGIKTASFNTNGQLVITLTDNTEINLGNAVGANGKDGENGTNGTNGQDGKDGKDGISITTANINADGQLVIAFSNGESVNLDKVVGTNGNDGISVPDATINTDGTSETHDLSGLLGGNNAEEDSQLKFVSLTDGTYGVRASDEININDLVSVEIPATYKGIAVTQIMAEGFKDAISLESVSLPSGLTTINGYAFNGCTSLTSIVIPDTVTTIKEYAFYSSGVTSISLDTTKNWTVLDVYYTLGTSSGKATLTNNGTTTLSGGYFTADISTPDKIAVVFTKRRGAFNSYYYYDVYKGVWTCS